MKNKAKPLSANTIYKKASKAWNDYENNYLDETDTIPWPPTKGQTMNADEIKELITELKRVGEYHAATLIEQQQKEIAVLKKALDIGIDPLKHDDWKTYRSTEAMKERIMNAMSIQQEGIPDQTALVWRIDISQLHSEHTQQSTYIKAQQKELEKANSLAASMSKLHDDECKENQGLKDEIEELKKTIPNSFIRSALEAKDMEVGELRRTILLMKPYVKGQHSWSCRNSTREICTCEWEDLNKAIDAAMQETKPK